MAKKLTKQEFIKKSIQIHGNKYDYSKTEYVNSRSKICIICPEHGEFWQTSNTHLDGSGCPLCWRERRGETIKLSKEIFIEKAKKVHGNKYDYSKVEYINCDTKICIICPEHGEFWQTPSCHINGKHGCPKCSQRSYKKTTEEFIEESKRIFGEIYDYSKVEYVNKNTPVCIICPEHGEFWQTPKIHLKSK